MWSDFPCKLTGSKARPKIRVGKKFFVFARVVLERKLGRPIRPRRLACHHCNNGLCIEPEHIYEGTYRTNALDSGVGGWAGRGR